jgi:hypothetical protein
VNLFLKRALHDADNEFSGSGANKRQRVSQVTGPIQSSETVKVPRRTENPLLEDIERKALAAIHERRKHIPASSTVSVSKNIWANELVLEIAAQMVHEVRADVTENYRGCSPCYMIAGEAGTTHRSGKGCPKMPLTRSTVGWTDFKDNLKFAEGIMCWNCLLPTVILLPHFERPVD